MVPLAELEWRAYWLQEWGHVAMVRYRSRRDMIGLTGKTRVFSNAAHLWMSLPFPAISMAILSWYVMRINTKGPLLSKPVHRTAIIRQVVYQLLLHSRKQWGKGVELYST
jgi:hypothetical protein